MKNKYVLFIRFQVLEIFRFEIVSNTFANGLSVWIKAIDRWDMTKLIIQNKNLKQISCKHSLFCSVARNVAIYEN